MLRNGWFITESDDGDPLAFKLINGSPYLVGLDTDEDGALIGALEPGYYTDDLDPVSEDEATSPEAEPDGGAQDEFNEADHPRGQPGNAGQFGSGGGGAAGKGAGAPKAPEGGKATGEAAKSNPAEPDGGAEAEFKTKKDHAGHLLKKGTTAKELMAILGWPSISVPATAKSLGMNLTKVKEGKITKYIGTPMTAAERQAANLPPEGIRRSGGPAARDPASWSLFESIVSRGGINPKDALIGDVRSLLGTKNKFVPGFGSLIRPGGMSLDKMREAMIEDGYLFEIGNVTGGEAQTTISTLLEAMDRESRGDRIYKHGADPEHVEAERKSDILEANRRHADEQIDKAMADVDMDPASLTEKQRARVLQIMEKEGISDPLEAIEREAMEWVNDEHDRGKAERILDDIPGWDVPDDAGAAPKPSGAAAPF